MYIQHLLSIFLQKVVDTVYSLLDVAKDGAADVVNIKVAVQIELNEQPNFLSKTKLSGSRSASLGG